jgi:hypothetical protein
VASNESRSAKSKAPRCNRPHHPDQVQTDPRSHSAISQPRARWLPAVLLRPLEWGGLDALSKARSAPRLRQSTPRIRRAALSLNPPRIGALCGVLAGQELFGSRKALHPEGERPEWQNDASYQAKANNSSDHIGGSRLKAAPGPRDSPHPCGTYGAARPARTLLSTALSRPSLIRMRPLVQVQPGPQISPVTSSHTSRSVPRCWPIGCIPFGMRSTSPTSLRSCTAV